MALGAAMARAPEKRMAHRLTWLQTPVAVIVGRRLRLTAASMALSIETRSPIAFVPARRRRAAGRRLPGADGRPRGHAHSGSRPDAVRRQLATARDPGHPRARPTADRGHDRAGRAACCYGTRRAAAAAATGPLRARARGALGRRLRAGVAHLVPARVAAEDRRGVRRCSRS